MARSLQETERELEEMDRKIETIQHNLKLRHTEIANLISADVPEASVYEALRRALSLYERGCTIVYDSNKTVGRVPNAKTAS